MEETRECPYFAEMVKSKAIICKYCHSKKEDDQTLKKGKLIKVKMKAKDKMYWGDVFVPEDLKRPSDVFNDERKFFLLLNTREETSSSEIRIGFLAINKNAVEWIRLVEEEGVSKHIDIISNEIYSAT